MPRQRQTVELKEGVEIGPELRAELAAKLNTYNAYKFDYDLLEEQMDTEIAGMKTLLESNGIKSVEIDGLSLTIVTGLSSKLDKLKFVELGGSLEQLKNATVSKPKRAYLLVGKEKKHEED